MSIILAIIIFSVLVLFHEFGHFLFAKLSGITVLEFSLGMGPTIVSFERGGTKYCIKCLPFGGSCMMDGEDEDSDKPGSFNAAPIWGRIATVAAGPVFNFILAFVVSVIVVALSGYSIPTVTSVDENSELASEGLLKEGDLITSINGYGVSVSNDLYTYVALEGVDSDQVKLTYKRDGKKETIVYVPESEEKYMLGFSYYQGDDKAEISSISLNGAMYKAGMQAGDIILEIDDTVINSGDELESYFEAHPLSDAAVTIKYSRSDRIKTVEITPTVTENVSLGFTYNFGYEKANVGQMFFYGFQEMKYWIKTTILSLKMLVSGGVSVNDMSGPVGIVTTIGSSYEESKAYGLAAVTETMLTMMILLSANLGVMNLLPIPALDGGRLVFLIIEAIRRKPINREIEGRIHLTGFAILMVFILYITVHDVIKLF